MNLSPNDDQIDPQGQHITHKSPHPLKRRQSQLFSFSLNSRTNQKMPKDKGNASGNSRSLQQPAWNDTPRSDIGVFLKKIEKPISDMQKLLTEYPAYEDQFFEYHETRKREKDLVKELEEKDKRIKELENGVATFDSVHMRASEGLKAEVRALKERHLDAEKRMSAARKEHTKELDKLKTQHNQEMEKANFDHSTFLATQKTQLEKQYRDANDRQISQLSAITSELQKKKSEIEELDWKNNGLKKKLDQSNAKLKALQQELASVSDDLFESKWRELAEAFHLFCKTSFTSLPQGQTVEEKKFQQQNIKECLRRSGFADKIPFPIPTGNIEASRLLRLAGVENLISQSLCENIFRPVVIPNCPNASGIFESISERLHQESPWKEAMWRSLTVNALTEDNAEHKFQSMASEIMRLTSPLIHREDREIVKGNLMNLFKLASDAWRPAQKNSTRIFATTDLAKDSLMLWDSPPEQDDFGGVSEDELKGIDLQSKILCLFPRVYRGRVFTTDSDANPEDKGYIYFPGTALYADSGAYLAGQKEHREYLKLMEDLEKKNHAASADLARLNSRRSRRSSINRTPQRPPTPLRARRNSLQSVIGSEVGSNAAPGPSQREPPASPEAPR